MQYPLTSYHNHTTWSDGVCSIQDQIVEARRLGLAELGISDHFVLSPAFDPVEWSMPVDKLGEYLEELRAAQARNPDIVLRLGVEADYFPETIDQLRDILAEHELDFVVGSVHYVDGFPIDESGKLWDALSQEECNEMWRKYWIRVREMAESRVFDFAAHLDLPKKFGHRPTVDLTEYSDAALDAISAANMAIEINTNGLNLPARELYPSQELLKAAFERNIPLLINSDAHIPTRLTEHFEAATKWAELAGYTELVRYCGRKIR